MEYEMDYRPSTRVGKFVWDIDVESMGIEELEALAEIAECFKAKRTKEEALMKSLRHTLEKIEQAGYHLVYNTDKCWVDMHAAALAGALQLDEL